MEFEKQYPEDEKKESCRAKFPLKSLSASVFKRNKVSVAPNKKGILAHPDPTPAKVEWLTLIRNA